MSSTEKTKLNIDRKVEVLIVGAGSSGLMMAAQLLRQGVHPIIIDQKLGLEKQDRPVLLHARTLEMLRQMGVQEDFLARGVVNRQIEFENLAPLDFEGVHDAGTLFPFVLSMTEGEVNHLLVEQLTNHTCPIQWGVQLIDLQEFDDRVWVEVAINDRKNIRIERWQVNWLIAADGQNSLVRNKLDIPYENSLRTHMLFRMDLAFRSDTGQRLPGNNRQYPIRFLMPKPVFRVVVPSGKKNQISLIQLLSSRDLKKVEQDEEAFLKDQKESLLVEEQVTPQALRSEKFLAETRIASQFASRRCFLIGSAAHQHHALTGKSVNEGFLDAWNLAWKLAGVVNGRMGRQVLFSYHQERHAQAKRQATSQGYWQSLILQTMKNIPRLSARFFPVLLNRFLRKPGALTDFFKKFSKLDNTYKNSPLSVHYSLSEKVWAGDRLPYQELFDEKTKTITDTHKWCEKLGFTLLIMGGVSHHQLHVIGQWIKQKYPQGVHLYYLPYSQRNHEIFDRMGIAPESHQLILVRPDMHIAYMTHALNTALIDNYLSKTMDWKLYRQFEQP